MHDFELPRPDLVKVSLLIQSIRFEIYPGTNASIQYKNSHVRLDSLPDLHHFFEKFWFLLVSAWRIHDNHVKSFFLKFWNTLSSNYDWVCLGVRSKVGYFRLGCWLPRLIEGAGAERVCANDGGFEPAFLVVDRKFCACRGFAVTLKCDRK